MNECIELWFTLSTVYILVHLKVQVLAYLHIRVNKKYIGHIARSVVTVVCNSTVACDIAELGSLLLDNH